MSVPLFSIGEGTGADRIQGVRCRTDASGRPIPTRFPRYLSPTPGGDFEVLWATYKIEDGFGYQPSLIAGTEQVFVLPSGWRQMGRRAMAPPSLSLTYDHAGAPAGVSQNTVVAAANRALGRYSKLFRIDSFNVRFSIKWDPTLPTSIWAISNTFSTEFPWNSVRSAILGTHQNFLDSDSDEYDLYLGLPASFLPFFEQAFGGIERLNIVNVPQPLIAKWFAPIDDMVIRMNPNRSFDFSADEGTPRILLGAGDFEGILVHEMGHHFGFQSFANLSILNPEQLDRLTIWDIFRFPTGTQILSEFNFAGYFRQLAPDSTADAVCAINDPFKIFELSPFGPSSSHWADYPAGSLQYIGLMAPAIPVGVSLSRNGYFQTADVIAFDLIGYEINRSGMMLLVQAPALLVPAPNARVNAPPTLTWSNVSGAENYSITVEDLGISSISNPNIASPGTVVYHEVTASTNIVPPPATFAGGHVYRWYSVAQNWNGYASSFDRAFFVSSTCPSDLNGDVAVDDSDFLLFMVHYNLLACADQSMPIGCPSDFNNDGNVDDSDFLIFIAAYDALLC
ncbi:MAG: hypothetical protein JNK16_13705 [Phycisphaerales bacterium]|nr:hypothetical protein [Phycisphaerales bacterium]